jgi:hypothetical protein
MIAGSQGNGFCSMKSCDFDNDGDYDVVTLETPDFSNEDKIWIWQNPNNSSVSCWTTWSNQLVANMIDISSVGDLDVGDLNNDGWIDIVYAGRNSTYDIYGVTVFKNDGTPWNNEWASNQHTINGNAYPNNVCVSDIDLDGDLDVVASLTDGKIYGWQNLGDPFNFGMLYYLLIDIADYIYTIGIDNIDNSMYPDLIVCDSSGDIYIYQNDGSPWNTWTTSSLVGNPGSQVITLTTCDYNLDGSPDIITGDQGGINQIDVWLSPGRDLLSVDSWTLSTSYSSPGYLVASVSCVDLDNDGDNDIVSGDYSGYILTHRNSLIGSGGTNQIGSVSGSANGLALVNLDRRNAYDNLNPDIGDIDIVVADSAVGSGVLYLFENVGASTNISVYDISPSLLQPGNPYALLKITITHNGIISDNEVEIQELRFQYRNGDDTGNLTSSDISDIANTHLLAIDDGDGIWEGLGVDLVVGSTYSISGNIVIINPTSEPATARIGAMSSKTYYYVIITRSPLPTTSFRVRFDPDGINSSNGWTQIEDAQSDKIATIEPTFALTTKQIWTVVPEFEQYAIPVCITIIVTCIFRKKYRR